MLVPNGAELLTEFSKTAYPKTITPITDKVYHVMGLGHSNASFIIAEESVILIDTLDSFERGQALLNVIQDKTEKPVKTIIYTHGHPDHRGGATAFQDTVESIIAFTPAGAPLGRMDVINPELMRRSVRQFGYNLSDEEAISQGIGIREGLTHGETRKPLPPTKLYEEKEVQLELDGIVLQMQRAVGETDDQISIWYEAEKILFSGDNYYSCWPNIYALRGTPYRDLSRWIDTLDRLKAFPAEALLPGHTRPIIGNAEIQATLTAYRDALDYVLTATLQGLAEGKRMDDLAEEIQLPPELASLPFLGEFYGSVEWSVKGIYGGYVGWFDGNPTQLHPLNPADRAEKLIDLMGGREKVFQTAKAAVSDEPQWAAELADFLLNSDADDEKARLLKADALEALAPLETSANGRHYYLEYAKELRNGTVTK